MAPAAVAAAAVTVAAAAAVAVPLQMPVADVRHTDPPHCHWDDASCAK